MAEKEHITKVTSAIALGAEVYLDAELEKKIQSLPEDLRDDFKNQAFKSAWFKRVADQVTPFDFLKERKGPWDTDAGDFKKLEYFPDDYTITELDRVYPGWWMEDMKSEFINTLRAFLVTGYLCVEYPTFSGMQVVKRWASAGHDIEYKKDTNEPSGASNAFISARTYWIKSAGKLYGIGLDIYHQRITPELRSIFEDRVRYWGMYAQEAKDVAATLETGHGFRKYIQELPNPKLTERIVEALKLIPPDTVAKDGNIHDLVWKQFVKLRMDSNANRQQAEQFISQVEVTAQQFANNKKEV